MGLTRYFGLGREIDFATVVAADRFVESVVLLNSDQGFILSSPICDSNLARYNLGMFRTRGAVGPFDVASDNIGEMIHAVMGGEAYSHIDYGTPIVSRRHEWMCGNILDSYTLRIGAEIEERILAGMLADKLKFKTTHGNNLKGTMEWVGPGAAETTVALSSLFRSNLAAFQPFVYHNASGLVTIGTDEKSSNVFDFEIEINNKLPFQRGSMSSRYMATKRHGSRTVTGMLSAFFDDDDEYDRFLAGVPFKLDLTFRGALIGQGRYHEIRFLLNNCVYLKDVGHPIQNQDEPLVIDCPFQGLYDSTYTELMIELESTDLMDYHLRYNPSAWNYDNLIGFIWVEGNPAGYDNAPAGQVEVREPIGTDPLGETRGGTYDTRWPL